MRAPPESMCHDFGTACPRGDNEAAMAQLRGRAARAEIAPWPTGPAPGPEQHAASISEYISSTLPPETPSTHILLPAPHYASLPRPDLVIVGSPSTGRYHHSSYLSPT